MLLRALLALTTSCLITTGDVSLAKDLPVGTVDRLSDFLGKEQLRQPTVIEMGEEVQNHFTVPVRIGDSLEFNVIPDSGTGNSWVVSDLCKKCTGPTYSVKRTSLRSLSSVFGSGTMTGKILEDQWTLGSLTRTTLFSAVSDVNSNDGSPIFDKIKFKGLLGMGLPAQTKPEMYFWANEALPLAFTFQVPPDGSLGYGLNESVKKGRLILGDFEKVAGIVPGRREVIQVRGSRWEVPLKEMRIYGETILRDGFLMLDSGSSAMGFSGPVLDKVSAAYDGYLKCKGKSINDRRKSLDEHAPEMVLQLTEEFSVRLAGSDLYTHSIEEDKQDQCRLNVMQIGNLPDHTVVAGIPFFRNRGLVSLLQTEHGNFIALAVPPA